MLETLTSDEYNRIIGRTPDLKRQGAAKALPPRAPKGMNKLEQRMNELLRGMLARGEIQWYGYECLTFKLADDTRFTPDFIVIYPDGSIEARETKGFWREDAKIKIKVAAAKFHWLTFAAFKFVKGQWEREQF